YTCFVGLRYVIFIWIAVQPFVIPTLATNLLTVGERVASEAKRDEILFVIFAGVAAKLFVVDFKVRHGTAQLASPAIALQSPLAQLPVTFISKPDRHLFRQSSIH